MKVTIDQNKENKEIEVVVKCSEMNDEVLRILSQIRIQEKKITGLKRGNFHIINLNTIFYFESVDNRTIVYTSDDDFETTLKLYEIEESLSKDDFIRISKSIVVNFQKITEISPLFNGKLEVILENKEKLEVSKNYAPSIKEKLLR